MPPPQRYRNRGEPHLSGEALELVPSGTEFARARARGATGANRNARKYFPPGRKPPPRAALPSSQNEVNDCNGSCREFMRVTKVSRPLAHSLALFPSFSPAFSSCLYLRNERQIFLWPRRRARDITSQASIAQRTPRFEESREARFNSPLENAQLLRLLKNRSRRDSCISARMQKNSVPRREVVRVAKISDPAAPWNKRQILL